MAGPVQTIIRPNMGLLFDKPALAISERGFQDGMNFRCKNGTVQSLNLGWTKFTTNFILNGPVSLIDNFFPRNLNEQLIFGSPSDLYLYHSATDSVTYLTPIYATGTASASGTAVTGVGTSWSANAKVGDEIHFGSATANDPTVTWYTIHTVNSNTSITLNSSAGTIGSGTYTIRKKFQAPVDPQWSVDTFINDGASGSDLWFATNGLDWVITWNGTDPTVTLHPELGFTCKTLATYKNMMIYGNITQSGNSLFSTIINSDVGLPLHAGATGTGLSEQFIAHSHTDPILNLIPIGDYLVIYASRTIVPAQFVGSPLIFVFRVAISGIGPMSANAIADFGDFHEFPAADAGYMFDGVTLKETNPHVWREILRQADPLRRYASFGHFDEENGDLIWSIPGNTDAGVGVLGANAEIGWAEHYLEDTGDPNFQGSPFSKRSFPFTMTGFYERQNGTAWQDATFQWQTANFAWNDQFLQLAFPLNMAGDHNGQLYVFNTDQKADGVPLPSFVRTNRWFMTSGRERDLLTRVYPFAHSFPFNLDVKLYMGDYVGANPSPKGVQQYDMTQAGGTKNAFVVFYRRGRTAELTFGSDAGDPWVLDGWTWDKRSGGMR